MFQVDIPGDDQHGHPHRADHEPGPEIRCATFTFTSFFCCNRGAFLCGTNLNVGNYSAYLPYLFQELASGV